MIQVNVTQFRQNLFEYLDRLPDEPIELLNKGKIIARVLPIEDLQTQALIALKRIRETAKLSNPLDDFSGALSPDDWSADEDHIA